MSKLKEQMINEMVLRGLSKETHGAYLSAVRKLSNYHSKPLEQLDQDEIKDFILFLIKEKRLSASTVRQVINGIFFFYYKVLKRPKMSLDIPLPKIEKKIPEILNPLEISNIINNTVNIKQKTLLMTAYSTGVRVSELVSLRISDIDSDRMVIRVEQGKGKKDRYTILTPTLLKHLREYYKAVHPKVFLFNGRPPESSLSVATAHKYFKRSCAKSKITKKVTFHGLRHAFATHQILNGMPVTALQVILGHNDLRTTMRYVHIARMPSGDSETCKDLLNVLNQIQEI